MIFCSQLGLSIHSLIKKIDLKNFLFSSEIELIMEGLFYDLSTISDIQIAY